MTLYLQYKWQNNKSLLDRNAMSTKRINYYIYIFLKEKISDNDIGSALRNATKRQIKRHKKKSVKI